MNSLAAAKLPEPPADVALHRGPGWFLTWIDGVEVAYMDQRMNAAGVEGYLTLIEERIKAPRQPRPVLYEVKDPHALTSDFRRRTSELLNRNRQSIAQVTQGFALVTTSPATRGILTAILWLSPPPYPHKLCSTTRTGFQWLATCASAMDPGRVHARYEELKGRLLPDL